jgi:hypothetical protein
MNEILQHLKEHKEAFDSEIADAMGISLHSVRLQASVLAANHEIMVCYSVRFSKGEKIEGMLCRIAGYIPPAAPGRKSKAQLKLSQTP